MPGSRSKSRIKSKATRLPVIIVAVAAVILLAAAVVTEIAESRKASTDEMTLEEYFQSGGDKLAVVRDYALSFEDAFCEEGRAYVSIAFLKTLNPRFYYDETEKLLLYTLPDRLITADRSTVFENGPVLRERDGRDYVYFPYAAQYTDLSFRLVRQPDRLVIRTDFSARQSVPVKTEGTVRQDASKKSPILLKAAAGEELILLSRDTEWAHVATEDGISGYIRCDEVGVPGTVRYEHVYEDPAPIRVSDRQDLLIVWDLVSNWDDNAHLEEYTANMTEANVLCSTWFRLADALGNIESLASEETVKWAHSRGMESWVLLNNVDKGVVGDTLTKLLCTTSLRQKLVANLTEETLRIGADGINVDIESLPQEAGDGFIQFIRELSLACHQEGLVLSVDNYVPSAWTRHYSRAEQALFADYIVIMGYDEHYSGSDAGPTASLPFVRKGVEDTLKEVPADRIINAVPFYTRLWKGFGSTLSSSMLSMAAVKNTIETYALSPVWDAESGLSYVEFQIGSTEARLWLEDEDSMTARLTALKEYGLAGIACWRLGLELDTIWDVFARYR